MTPLERAKGRTLKEIAPIVRSIMWLSRMNTVNPTLYGWQRERLVRVYAGVDEDRKEECNAFIDWALNDHDSLQEYIAERSPSTAAELAVRAGKRLNPAAEKHVTEKAKTKPKLLEYCTHFGIMLDDITKVTMKAAFDEGATREKEYIRKIEHTKKRMKEFLGQMVSMGQVSQDMTVKELIETL